LVNKHFVIKSTLTKSSSPFYNHELAFFLHIHKADYHLRWCVLDYIELSNTKTFCDNNRAHNVFSLINITHIPKKLAKCCVNGSYHEFFQYKLKIIVSPTLINDIFPYDTKHHLKQTICHQFAVNNINWNAKRNIY
jgi:hypothetical protein